MFILKGLFALLFISVFFSSDLSAKYLYKDEIIFNPAFEAQVDKIGSELYEKSGIKLLLVMLKKLPDGKNIVEYQSELLKDFNEPTILLTFSELDLKVDILANDTTLYNYFDKKQVLSPVASSVQAFIMALFYNNGFESFKEIASSHGGTILPLLAQKAKPEELLGKYSASMFNGYADIAQQLAKSKNIELQSSVGDANQKSILFLKVIFYGFILYALYLYIKRKVKRNEN